MQRNDEERRTAIPRRLVGWAAPIGMAVKDEMRNSNNEAEGKVMRPGRIVFKLAPLDALLPNPWGREAESLLHADKRSTIPDEIP